MGCTACVPESCSIVIADMLEEALSVLRLREFAWYGCHPMPPSKVLEEMSTGSRDTLENIVLPYVNPQYHFSEPDLAFFPGMYLIGRIS